MEVIIPVMVGLVLWIARDFLSAVFKNWYKPKLQAVPVEVDDYFVRSLGVRFLSDIRLEGIEAPISIKNSGPVAGSIDRCVVTPADLNRTPRVEIVEFDRTPIKPFRTETRAIRFRYEYRREFLYENEPVTFRIECFSGEQSIGGIRLAAIPRLDGTPGPIPPVLGKRRLIP